MYQLVSALGKPFVGSARWAPVEIGELTMLSIYQTYRKVYAVLTNEFIEGEVCLDLEAIRADYATSESTFNEVLAALGNQALPTTDQIPEIKTRYAKYNDARRAYTITPVPPYAAPDAELPESEKTWLFLQRKARSAVGPAFDYEYFYKHCLVSVNGFYHRTDFSALGAYVVEGDVSRKLSKRDQVGILSFREIGELEFVPITPEMVYTQSEEQSLRHRTYVDVGVDLAGKTPMLVLGGYLHAVDSSILRVVGDQHLMVSVENLPLFERYYESRPYIDLSGLPVETSTNNPFQIAVEEFLSDECLRAYFSLPQSFVVLVNNEDMFADLEVLQKVPEPGKHTTYTRPEYPMVAGYGFSPNYWAVKEDGQYAISTHDTLYRYRVFNTTDPYKQQSLDDSMVSGEAETTRNAHFLKIGADLLF